MQRSRLECFSVESNRLQRTQYDGSETAPYPPVRFVLTGGTPENGTLSWTSFCAEVKLGDTNESFVQCIDGYTE